MFSEFSFWHILYVLITTHITIVTVTVYLHRGLAHRSLSISKPLEHFFRFWCWLTTAQNPKEWAAVHRKHHSFCEREGDPHSPKLYGIWNVLFKGVALYHKEAKNPETIKRFGHMTPDDKLQQFYAKNIFLGVLIYSLIAISLFGLHSLWIVPVQLAWIPFWAAGVINGVGHHKGYRNFNTTDLSTNISPWGIIIGGEELHNNHHAYPTSAKLSFKWYEFDIGWVWISLFKSLKLLSVNKVYTLPKLAKEATVPKIEVILSNKSYVLRMFYKKTKHEVLQAIRIIKSLDLNLKKYSDKELTYVFYHDTHSNIPLNNEQKTILEKLLNNKFLAFIYQKIEELLTFWNNKTADAQQLKEQLILWIASVKENNKNNKYYYLENFANNLLRLS